MKVLDGFGGDLGEARRSSRSSNGFLRFENETRSNPLRNTSALLVDTHTQKNTNSRIPPLARGQNLCTSTKPYRSHLPKPAVVISHRSHSFFSPVLITQKSETSMTQKNP